MVGDWGIRLFPGEKALPNAVEEFDLGDHLAWRRDDVVYDVGIPGTH